MRIPFFAAMLLCLLTLMVTPALAATNATDPTGDNCNGSGSCGPDLTGAADRVDAGGTVYLSITRASSICDSFSYPATEVQPWFQVMSSASTAVSDGSSVGAVWAVSGTSDFMWTPAGGGGDVPVASTVTAGSVEVVLPASIITSVGGLPLKWYVNNSCKDFPHDPPTAYTDFAPDSGLYTLAADQPDVCPNIAGSQATVPAGMFVDGSGNCVSDACPNIAGGQSSVPAGMFVDASGSCAPDVCPNLAGGQATVPAGYVRVGADCLQVTFNGTAAANTLIGNILANIIKGIAGNDTLFGRAGNDTVRGGAGNDKLMGEAGKDKLQGDAGNDQARGGAGNDTVTGGAGRDKLWGDAGRDKLWGDAGRDKLWGDAGRDKLDAASDHRGGDVVNGGAGVDICYYNAGDIVTGCERKIRRS